MVSGLNFSGAPVSSALRRSDEARSVRTREAASPKFDCERVGSSRASNCPRITTDPSCTISFKITPPSSESICCALLDGVTLPVPTVTSSSTAKRAQTKKISRLASDTQIIHETLRPSASSSSCNVKCAMRDPQQLRLRLVGYRWLPQRQVRGYCRRRSPEFYRAARRPPRARCPSPRFCPPA